MEEIIRIGLDTAKQVFRVHGVDPAERPILRRTLRRGALARFFAGLPPPTIGLEACGGAHHWGRVLGALGHRAVLLPPQYVRPYVKRGKNAAADAAAICAAMSRPGMRFVPVRTAENQAALMLHRARDLLVCGAMAVIGHAKRGRAAPPWLGALLARKPAKLAAVALANKNARIAWAMMMRGEGYTGARPGLPA